MKKLVFTAAIIGFAAITSTVTAQKDKVIEKDKKESQEIIIRKKGDKDTKITVEIKGDDISINGKPLSEYKDDEITINRRNVIIRDGKGNSRYEFSPGDFDGLTFWNNEKGESRAFLGVTTEKVDGGAKITNVSEESAAAKSGLKEGDIISKVGDKKIDGPESLFDAISSMKPKDNAKVFYKRDGKESSANAVLGERKDSGSMAYSFSGPDGLTRSFTAPRVQGIPRIQSSPKVQLWSDKEFGEMSPKLWSPGGESRYYELLSDAFPRQQKLGLKIQDTEDGKGVKVLDVDKDSPAEKAGLKKDDVVTEIGGKKVSNTDEVREQLHDNMDKSSYSIKASRNGNAMNFDIKIPKKLKTANL
ncbi:MAG: PDZ domain-containing protein [Ferruginibacter sp.]